MVDAFDGANLLSITFQGSHIMKNIRSGFHKNGTLNFYQWCPSWTTLCNFVYLHSKPTDSTKTIALLLETFERKCWTLLSDSTVKISDNGTIQLNVSCGIQCTFTDAISGLRDKEKMKAERQK